MIPTTSSPSSVLLNPVAQSGNSTVAIDAEAAPDGALSGFQLLLGAMQQKLPVQADAGDTQGNNADNSNADGGNALPQLGTILPSLTLPQATPGESAQAGEANSKTKDKQDSDTDVVAIDVIPTPVVIPAIVATPSAPSGFAPPGSATKTTEAADTVLSGLALTRTDISPMAQQASEAGRSNKQAVASMSPAGTAAVDSSAGVNDTAADTTTNTMASTVANTTAIVAANTIVNSKEIVTVDTKTNSKADMPAIAAATTTASSAVITATAVKDVQGESKPTATSDFDELVKHFDTTTSAQRSTANAIGDNTNIGASAGISTHQAARTYFDTANNTTSIAVPVGSSGWSDAVTDKVMWFSANKISSAEIHLNPPDLGPLQVRVSTQLDQTSVVFTSQHAAVRDALDQALPRLREMMGSQGMQQLDVSVGGQSAQQQQQQFSRNGAADRGVSFGGLYADDSAESAAVGVTAIDTARLLRSGVDAYA